MGWKTIIIGCESKVSLTLNRMRITINDEYQNIPLSDIDTVIFSHIGVVITIPLLSKLIENNINIIICDEKNDPIGIFQPFNTHSLVFKRLNNQLNWKLTRKKKFWKIIIEQKIQSEIEALIIEKRNNETIKQLNIYKDSVYTDDQTNREAIAARLYFQELFGKNFTRDENTIVNAALNYGYKIIASYISKCISSRGLITQLGVHHIGESNPFNLTYDFIETFRVFIDLWVYENIKTSFGTYEKTEIINILNYKINISNKWMRMCDAIEDVIDSYIAFLDERENSIIVINYSKGMKNN